jgi:uncharacterized protein (TIGR03086 family)
VWLWMVSFVRSMALKPYSLVFRRAHGTPLGEFLERYPMEFLVHTWDLAQATGQAARLEPDLVHEALEPARQFTPVGRATGLVGPERAVAQDADDLTRLLAIFGRSAST